MPKASVKVGVRLCLNCKERAAMRFFCVDCWHMGLLAILFSGSGGEALHHIAEKFGFLKW